MGKLHVGSLVLLVALVAACGSEGDVGVSGDDYLRQAHPCDRGSCWETSLDHDMCGFVIQDEDFASGRFNVHRYRTDVSAGTTRLTVARASGTWEPALVLAEPDGRIVFDGRDGAMTAGLTARAVARGHASVFEVEIEAADAQTLDVYVSSQGAVATGFVATIPTDASYELVADNRCAEDSAFDELAPPGVVDDVRADAGTHAIDVGGADWGTPLRFDVPAGTLVTFTLDASGDREIEVLGWFGDVFEMARAHGDRSERVLSVLDADVHRTYWVRARGGETTGQLSASYLPFREGMACQHDCGRLLQMPLPNDSRADGYDMEGDNHHYRFGRREVLMSVRHAGRVVAAAGIAPFTIEDLSRASGQRPPGHASHTSGKDIDLSVYDAAGDATWQPLCNEVSDSCISGTSFGMDMRAMATKIGALLESGHVTKLFLDREFHSGLFDAADDLVSAGDLSSAAANHMQAVVQHWRNHNNHIHIRYQD